MRWRTTNANTREKAELRQLYEIVDRSRARFLDAKTAIAKSLHEYFERDLSEPIQREMDRIVLSILEAENCLRTVPPLEHMDFREEAACRELLALNRRFLENEKTYIELLHETLIQALLPIGRELPEIENPSPFTIPLVFALPDPRNAIEHIYSIFIKDQNILDHRLFTGLYDQLRFNIYAASGREVGDTSRKPIVAPLQSKLPLEQVVDTYLGSTPFQRLFRVPVPLKLTHDDRMNHMHVVGGSGSGKTSLIENLLLYDIQSIDPPSLVVIDPHSDLIRKLTRADLGIGDRLILIDPRDTNHFPSLNIFALNKKRMGTYDEATREQVTAGAIQTLEYLFEGFGIDLTGKQQVLFRSVCRLMLSLPEAMGRNATIVDMMRLMSDSTPYQAAIDRLPYIQQDFFARDFPSQGFKQTREQVRYRLQALMDNPTLARLFTSPETKVDIFDELNRGSIILVDTAKDFLKDGSAVFGRLFISLVLQAIMERAAIPPRRRKDTFLVVDEAASVFNTNIDDLLTDARKFRCGCLFSHQYLAQAAPALQASLAANTSIKFASGLSAQDARRMAPEMRTTDDFILDQPRLRFAAHIRNVTPQAVSIPVAPGVLDGLPKLSDREYRALIETNRARVSSPRAEPTKQALLPVPGSNPLPGNLPDDDISQKW